MGLDTYAATMDGDTLELQKEGFEALGKHLVGGILSGHGDDGSFRGKIYDRLVYEVTGHSLYQRYIEPAVVARMQADLAGWLENHAHVFPDVTDPEDWIRCEDCTMDEEEAEALVRFFLVCRERGYGLHGWW